MTDAREDSQHGHVFRPGPFRRSRAYWLDGHVLRWQIGAETGHVHLANVVAMRLHLPSIPGHVQRCVLVERDGRTHRICDRYWPHRGDTDHSPRRRMQLHPETFRNLTFTLVQRLAKANPTAALRIGPGRGEWVATCGVAVAGLGILGVGTALMVDQGRVSLPGLAFMGMVAVQFPLLWPIIRSGGPRPLEPAALNRVDPSLR